MGSSMSIVHFKCTSLFDNVCLKILMFPSPISFVVLVFTTSSTHRTPVDLRSVNFCLLVTPRGLSDVIQCNLLDF
jgi:hypothetical protein